MSGLDEFDDVLEDLLEEAAFADWLSEGDHAQGQVPPVGTNHVAARILNLALSLDPRFARGFAAFGVGARGVQAEPTQQVGSLADVGFTGRDRVRVNLEVDPVGRIGTHTDDHLRAMRAAVRAGHSSGEARSVFVGVDNQGRIRDVRHVHYEIRRDNLGRERVVPVEDAHVRLERPLTPQEAWAQGLLQRPPRRPRAQPSARAHGAAAGRTGTRRSPAARGTRRGQRFDAFEDALAAY